MDCRVKSLMTLNDLVIDHWEQGDVTSPDDLVGQVVLVQVIQLNCPGCFLHALPEAIRLHREYRQRGLTVLALATAFEDFELNTLQNLQRLVHDREVIGATYQALERSCQLDKGRLGWSIPFAVGMDRVVPDLEPVDAERVNRFARQMTPDYDALNRFDQQQARQHALLYLRSKRRRAETFDRFELQGTPSSILFDRSGRVADIAFARFDHLQPLIEQYLDQAA